MAILNTVKNTIPPIHSEGYPFIAAFAVLTFVMGWFSDYLFCAGIALTIWCALFFRDPKRVTPVSDDLVISPADGRISQVGNYVPPRQLDMGSEPLTRISVFMNVFDCHINRSPVRGKIRQINYKKGQFNNAELDKASESNERNSLVIETDYGDVGVVQIAGLVARRIICWAEEGDSMVPGERFGLIRFGSRVDVYLPKGTTPLVAIGQRTICGETVLATRADEKAVPLVRTS